MKKGNNLPPALMANLQNVLIGRKASDGDDSSNDETSSKLNEEENPQVSSSQPDDAIEAERRPVVFVTSGDGIGSPGLLALVDALVRLSRYDVYVCAPDSDKSMSGHSVTVRETMVATSVEMAGAEKAFELSGTPADCVSLALSGSLFSWSRPVLVISGINKGLVYAQDVFFSGTVAGAREALLCGVPSFSISLDWKEDKSQESDFKDAANVSLPLISAAIADIEKGVFPNDCLLRLDIPTFPANSKGFRTTRSSQLRSQLNWQSVSLNRHASASQYMSKHQSLGIQLAQLGRDASAAGAARITTSQRKTVEIESVATAAKPESPKCVLKKYFRLELVDKEQEDASDDLDFKATVDGFVAVTPLCSPFRNESEIYTSVSNWVESAASNFGEVKG